MSEAVTPSGCQLLLARTDEAQLCCAVEQVQSPVPSANTPHFLEYRTLLLPSSTSRNRLHFNIQTAVHLYP